MNLLSLIGAGLPLQCTSGLGSAFQLRGAEVATDGQIKHIQPLQWFCLLHDMRVQNPDGALLLVGLCGVVTGLVLFFFLTSLLQCLLNT